MRRSAFIRFRMSITSMGTGQCQKTVKQECCFLGEDQIQRKLVVYLVLGGVSFQLALSPKFELRLPTSAASLRTVSGLLICTTRMAKKSKWRASSKPSGGMRNKGQSHRDPDLIALAVPPTADTFSPKGRIHQTPRERTENILLDFEELA